MGLQTRILLIRAISVYAQEDLVTKIEQDWGESTISGQPGTGAFALLELIKTWMRDVDDSPACPLLGAAKARKKKEDEVCSLQ